MFCSKKGATKALLRLVKSESVAWSLFNGSETTYVLSDHYLGSRFISEVNVSYWSIPYMVKEVEKISNKRLVRTHCVYF